MLPSFYTLNEQARAVTIFQPMFDTVVIGDKQNNQAADVCAVVGFKEPIAENVEEFFNLKLASKIWGTQESLSGFASRYLKQFEQFHQVAPGVEVDEFPEERFGKTMPMNQVDEIEDNDPDNF